MATTLSIKEALLDPEKLTALLNRLLRRDVMEKVVVVARWVLIGLSALVLSYTLAQIVNLYLTTSGATATMSQQIAALSQVDKAVQPSTHKDYSLIGQKNIFGEIGPKHTSVQQPVKTQTKLPLILIGTFLQDGRAPYAIIEDDKKKVQDVFNVNDMVFGDAKLVKILTTHVELNRGGQIEILSLDDAPDAASSSGGGSSSGGDSVTVDEKELTTALENLPLLLTQARAVPYFKDGKAIGLRMFAIKSGSLYEKVGLQNGDILKSINGNSLSDISQAMKLFETLKSERSLSVTLERNREEKQFNYSIR